MLKLSDKLYLEIKKNNIWNVTKSISLESVDMLKTSSHPRQYFIVTGSVAVVIGQLKKKKKGFLACLIIHKVSDGVRTHP